MTRAVNIWTLRDLRRALGRAKKSGGHVLVRLPQEFIGRRIAVITPAEEVDIGIEIDFPIRWVRDECLLERSVVDATLRLIDRAISKHGARAPIAVIVAASTDSSMSMLAEKDGILAVSEDQLGGDENADTGAATNAGCAGDTGKGDARTPMDVGQMGDGEPAADGAGTPTDSVSAGGENETAPAAADSAEEAGQDGEGRATGSEAAGESACDARRDAQQGDDKTGGMGSAAASTGKHDAARAGAPDDGGYGHGETGQGDAAPSPTPGGDAGTPAGQQPDAATGMEDGRESSSGAADEATEDTSQDAAAGAGNPDADPASGSSKTEARNAREDDGEPTDGGGNSPYGGPAMTEIAAAVLKARGAARQASMEIERLLRKVLAPRGRRVPLVDERKLVHEVITRRYKISRARREQGRIRPIVITPDGSGSCDLMIKATLPAAEAIRRTLGHDAVQIVPNANGCPYYGNEARDWPGWLRQIADEYVSDYAYSGRPVMFWRVLLASGRIAAIVYIGDGDADHVWRQVDDRRVIAIRERYGDPDVGRCQTVDIRTQDKGDAVAYLREIARQIRAAKVQSV